MSDDNFYDQQSEASEIKSRIVIKYFRFWAKIMVPIAKRHGSKLAYFDLFSGPGRYDNGDKSTPLLVLEEAIANPELCKLLFTLFNDKDSIQVDKLKLNIGNLPGIEKLKNFPEITNISVSSEFESLFENLELMPSFSFVDPFGYKGVTLKLLQGMLKDWGCDLVLFFSYNRINAAIENRVVEDHIEKFFGGTDNLNSLRSELHNRTPYEREPIILERFSQGLHDMGISYVLPFTFHRPDVKRTSHHLIFITKHLLAYTVMKEIMASESSESNQGVPTFTYTKSLSRDETPLLYLLERPLDELGDSLLTKFAGTELTMKDVFERHNVGTQFILKNYKAALILLEKDQKIMATPPLSSRPKRKGQPTFGDNVMIKFPLMSSI